MKIQYCSNLHLEFPENRRWLEANPLTPSAETLVIAGDCFYLGDDYQQYDFIRRVADEFEAVYILPGNHEYYGGYDVASALQPTFETIRTNVCIVNNTTADLQGVRLVFSTMWSLINKNIREVIRGLTDFRLIKYDGEPFNVNQFNGFTGTATVTFLSLRSTARGCWPTSWGMWGGGAPYVPER